MVFSGNELATAVSPCATVVVVASNLPALTSTFDGIYEKTGVLADETRSVFEDANRRAVMYFMTSVSAADSGRRLDVGPMPGWEARPHVRHSNTHGDNGGGQHRHHHHDQRRDGSGGVLSDGADAACDQGAWIIRQTDGTFPAYLVYDCADHPDAITSDAWYLLACETCEARHTKASFSTGCAPSTVSNNNNVDSYFGSNVDDYFGDTFASDDFYGGGDDDGPSPVPGPITNSPAVEILESFPTIAPLASADEDDDAGSSGCSTVTVLGSAHDGEYVADDSSFDSSGGRSMYSHSDGSVLEYVDLGRRRRLNLDSLTWWDRWMAGPSHEEGGRQRQFAQKENRETHDEHGNNGGFNTRGMTGKQSIGQGRANAGRTLREIHRRWTGAGLREKVKGRAHNILEACSEGAWILAASSELYPFSLAFDCAVSPIDVSTTWYDVEDVDSDPMERPDQLVIDCESSSSIYTESSSSSPGARVGGVQEGATADDDPTRSALEAEDSGGGGGGNDDWSVEKGLFVSGGLLVAGIAIGACLTGLLLSRHRKRKRSEQDRQQPPEPYQHPSSAVELPQASAGKYVGGCEAGGNDSDEDSKSDTPDVAATPLRAADPGESSSVAAPRTVETKGSATAARPPGVEDDNSAARSDAAAAAGDSIASTTPPPDSEEPEPTTKAEAKAKDTGELETGSDIEASHPSPTAPPATLS